MKGMLPEVAALVVVIGCGGRSSLLDDEMSATDVGTSSGSDSGAKDSGVEGRGAPDQKISCSFNFSSTPICRCQRSSFEPGSVSSALSRPIRVD